jgi:hypothetical protein
MKLNEMNSEFRPAIGTAKAYIDAVLEDRQFTDPEDFYQDAVVASGLFDEATQLFPGYNNTQSTDAAEWMMDQIEDLFVPGDANWASMRDEVYDKIMAGLT